SGGTSLIRHVQRFLRFFVQICFPAHLSECCKKTSRPRRIGPNGFRDRCGGRITNRRGARPVPVKAAPCSISRIFPPRPAFRPVPRPRGRWLPPPGREPFLRTRRGP